MTIGENIVMTGIIFVEDVIEKKEKSNGPVISRGAPRT